MSDRQQEKAVRVESMVKDAFENLFSNFVRPLHFVTLPAFGLIQNNYHLESEQPLNTLSYQQRNAIWQLQLKKKTTRMLFVRKNDTKTRRMDKFDVDTLLQHMQLLCYISRRVQVDILKDLLYWLLLRRIQHTPHFEKYSSITLYKQTRPWTRLLKSRAGGQGR